MITLCFGTNNQHKIDEVKPLMPESIRLITLAEAGCHVEVPELEDTIEGNSLAKAMYIYQNYLVDVFSDDSGLVIAALDGRPGVDSAHYSGTRNHDQNMAKVLHELESFKTPESRRAYFVTVITLCLNGQHHQFEGRLDGYIATAAAGEEGFGYDPIFIPDLQPEILSGSGAKYLTLAQLGPIFKSANSHRTKAVEKLLLFLHKKSA